MNVVRFGFLVFLLATVGTDSGIAGQSPQSNRWPTKEFRVLWYSPGLLPNAVSDFQDFIVRARLTDEEKMIREERDTYIKNSMSKIADYFERFDLRPPRLPISTDKEGVKRYDIYVYDFDSGWYTTERRSSPVVITDRGCVICRRVYFLVPST